MFENQMILTRGFRNTVEDGKVTGFQVKVRITYYRGLPLSCIEGFDVTVDGKTYPWEKVRYALGDRVYTVAQAAEETETHWPFGDPLTLMVEKPAGLPDGMHDIYIAQRLRISYHSPDANPSIAYGSKRIPLVV